MPHSVNGLRRLRTTALRHFPGQEKTVKEASMVGSFWTESTLRKNKIGSRKGAKLAEKKGDTGSVLLGSKDRQLLFRESGLDLTLLGGILAFFQEPPQPVLLLAGRAF